MIRSGLAAMLVGAPILVGTYLLGQHHNILFHSLAEFFTTVIACGIFMMAWNSRRHLDNGSLLFIGIAYLSVGTLDLVHALAYTGINYFPNYDVNLTVQLGMAARIVQGVSLFLAPFFVTRKLNAAWLLSIFVSITLLTLLSVFYWRAFPLCYTETSGLTLFSNIGISVASLSLLLSIVAFAKHRRYFDPHVFGQIILSVVFTIASGLLVFYFYLDEHSVIGVVGHVFKVVAFYFIYDAIIATGLKKPYDLLVRNLKQSETSLRETVEALTRARAELELRVRERTAALESKTVSLQREMVERKKIEEALRDSETKYRIVADNTLDWEWWLDPDGQFVYVSPSCKEVTGYDADDFMEDRELIYKIIHPEDRQKFATHVHDVDEKRRKGDVEFRILRSDGACRYLEHACQPVFDADGTFLGHRGSNRDITARRLAEDALRKSEGALRSLSSQLLAVQETERKRVAHEVHDGINQTLSAIKFGLESKLAQANGRRPPEGISLERLISLVHMGIDEARRIQMDLRPPMLDDLGILATLGWFTREFQDLYRHIRVDLHADVNEEDVPETLKVVMFRIVQESLNNISKHSRADFVRISLQKANNHIELSIEDNGVGFDVENARKGLGIGSMKERTELSLGSFKIRSVPQQGTTVVAAWPITEQRWGHNVRAVSDGRDVDLSL